MKTISYKLPENKYANIIAITLGMLGRRKPGPRRN
jgi:hypothetical protein